MASMTGWIGMSFRRIRSEEGALVAPLFALAGALARSDGRVSEAEIAAVELVLAVSDLPTASNTRASAS